MHGLFLGDCVSACVFFLGAFESNTARMQVVFKERRMRYGTSSQRTIGVFWAPNGKLISAAPDVVRYKPNPKAFKLMRPRIWAVSNEGDIQNDGFSLVSQ